MGSSNIVIKLHTIISEVEDRKSRVKNSNIKDLKLLSFFSGAMGLDIGLHKVGFKTLLACEIDKSSRETIVANNPTIGLIGDIRNYSTEDIFEYAGLETSEEVDLIVGGPPCQAFSSAGKRMGLADDRGNVFLKFIEVIENIKPKFGVMHPPESYNPLVIVSHEYNDIWNDVKNSNSIKDAFMYVFGAPGWSPDGSTLTAKQMQDKIARGEEINL